MRIFLLLSLLLLHASVCSSAWAKSGPDVFCLEKYGKISWEDEKIRLDNFAIQLMNDREPQTADVSQLVLKDVNGRTVRLHDYRGKVVLINFWATWCPPCRAEMPELIRLQREYAAHGLQIIGITYPPEKKDRVRRFARSLKVNYPIVLGTRRIKDSFTSEETLPLTVVMNRDGTVADIISGILLPQEFKEKIKPLLMRNMEGEKRNAKSDH